MQDVEKFYDLSYKKERLNAQRKWPNEEFCRFMGRNYFGIEYKKRKGIKILETGCGSGANLRLLVSEGFDSYGIDLSKEAIEMVPALLKNEFANVKQGNMLKLEYEDGFFDAVVDIFSSYCLNENEYIEYVKEVFRVLKKGGKFFAYTPSKSSEAYLNYSPANKIDNSTLNGIYRKDSPYYGNFYSFRFMDESDIVHAFMNDMFKIDYVEKVSKTYNNMMEHFDFLVFEVSKK